jgi:hypothetical protein
VSLPARLGADIRTPPVIEGFRARSSAGEHLVDIEGVTGSIPVAPTIVFNKLAFPSNGYGNDTAMPLPVSS